MSQFKNARNRCNACLRQTEYVKITQNNLSLELRKKLYGHEFSKLFQLTSQAVNYETILREEEQKKIKQ